MKFGKIILVLFVSISFSTVVFTTTAFAGPNVGACGLGSKLMEGNEGLLPQVFAVTTNNVFFGNQTFGITSGTLGCSQNGVVRSNWKTVMYINSNMNKLAADISAGEGEALEALAHLLRIEDSHKRAFYSTTRSNFSAIFPTAEVSSEQVFESLKTVLENDKELARYSSSL